MLKCPECLSENRAGIKFCEECGANLGLQCPACKARIPLGKKFCGECGRKISDPSKPPPLDYSQPQSYTPKFLADKILTHRGMVEGERKLITVLFADVANYTAISARLDPEDVHQVMDGCFKILMDDIHQHEGTINQFTGDGVMALFGAPLSHEDHAQRACRAALSIQKSMGEYSRKIEKERGIAFRIRMGLNTGPVIVGSIGDDLRMDYTAVGDTTNLAARIQQRADPGDIWLSRETHNIIRDYFGDISLGEISLKGKQRPEPVYRLVAEKTDVRTRFEAGLLRGVTRLVGRRAEINTLQAAFERAANGEAQVVDVVGEAGIGKSRLIFEFQKTLDKNVPFFIGLCIQYGRNINFLPVTDVVKAAFKIDDGMSEKEAGNLLEEQAIDHLAPMIPFYRSLLSLPVDNPAFKALSPEGRKFGTFEAVKSILLFTSSKQPLVLFLEDIHWMDKISEEFFTYFSRSFSKSPILMIAAYRPEGSPAWAQGGHYQRLGLETLSPGSSLRLVRNILDDRTIETEVEEKIIAKTGGNPFFIEEITRELIDRGDLIKKGARYVSSRPIEQLEIPNTVQGVLAARMDRLSEDLKKTMQIASVIGRDFAFRLLKTVMELGEEIRAHLANLVGLEIIYEKALYPELEYIFKHALTREVAYESLLRQKRREIHSRIARAIEALYAGRLEEHYEMLAHHYEQSGNAEKAADYLILAGEKSNRNNAVQNAYEFFQKARQLENSAGVDLDAQAKVRMHRGLARAGLNVADIDTAAYGFRKVIDISREHGMRSQERKGLIGLTSLMFMWEDRAEADNVLKEALDWAQTRDDRELESIVLANRGHVESTSGDLIKAHQTVIGAEQLALRTGKTPPIFTARLTRSFIEKLLGDPHKSVELTEGMVDSLRKSYALTPLMNVILVRGMALAEIGRIDESIELLMDGIELFEKLGASFRLGSFNNCIGYCYSEIHQHQTAWKYNLKSEEIVRQQMLESPLGRSLFGEILAQTNVNLMENLFDQGKLDEAWKRMESSREELKSGSFSLFRQQWESRMNYLTAQMLLERNDIDRAEDLIREGIQATRKWGIKKREGGFLRLLGEILSRRSEPEGAVSNLGQAVAILKDVGNPRQLWQAHASLAAVLNKIDKHSEASEQWGMAAEVISTTADGLSDRGRRQGFLKADAVRNILSKAQH